MHRHTLRRIRIGITAAVTWLALPATAAVFVTTVGDDAACAYRTSALSNALQSAVEAVPVDVAPTDLYVIRVARTGNYAGDPVRVEDRSLQIVGGYATCASATPDATNTVISTPGFSPLRILGVDTREAVTIANLTLRDGNAVIGSGVHIEDADVTLERVQSLENQSQRGGGVYVEGRNHGAVLRMRGGSNITGNTATQDGGGIYCGHNGRVEIEADVTISSNRAELYGGGIMLSGCSGYANSGALGILGLFVNIGFNEAGFGGGGIALRSDVGPTSFTIGHELGPADPSPVLVGNEADTAGGAIYASGADTELTLVDTVINGNTAGGHGGAIVAHGQARVLMTRARRACPRGDLCSHLVGNSALRGGAAFAMVGGQITLRGTVIEDNSASSAGNAAVVQGGDAVIELRNCLVAANGGSPSVFQVSSPGVIGDADARLVLNQTTIAQNPDATHVVDVNPPGTVRLAHSIINEVAGVAVFDRAPTYQPELTCSMVHEGTTLGTPDPATLVNAAPGFVDAAAGNFRLRGDAAATDRCSDGAGIAEADFEGDARPQRSLRVRPVPEIPSDYDIGYDEFTRRLFADGLETLATIPLGD